MEEQEAKVRAFKAKHFGDLPSQAETNVQILSGLQSQLLSAQRDLDAAKQQKLYLESLQQQYQTAQASMGSENSVASSPQALQKQLMDLRLQLEDARSRLTDESSGRNRAQEQDCRDREAGKGYGSGHCLPPESGPGYEFRRS